MSAVWFYHPQGRDSLSTNGLYASSRLLWCVMLTLPKAVCKSFFRMSQNCHNSEKRKRESQGFTPLNPLLPQILHRLLKFVNWCCVTNILQFFCCGPALRQCEPTCAPVSAFTAREGRVPLPQQQRQTWAVVRRVVRSLSPRKSDRSPASKTEQEKGGWSCATSHRSLRPAVPGVLGIPD